MINSTEQIIQGNRNAGQYFFSEDTMRFFRSRLMSRVFPVPGGAVFVTSERREGDDRKYTVRLYDRETGVVDTVDRFQAYATYNGAMAAAERYADQVKESD